MPTPIEDQVKAENLVRALGDRSFKVREQASHDLLLLGRPAFTALQQGLMDENPEIRARCRRLWPVVFEMDLHARLEAFLADGEGKQTHDLPGWQRFRKIAGADRQARELFAKMVRADGALMDLAENRPEELPPDRLGKRAVELQQLENNPNLRIPVHAVEYVQLLFLSSNPKIASTPIISQQIGSILYQAKVRALLTGDEADTMKKVILAWFESQVDDCPVVIYYMNNLNMKECLPMALKVARNKNAPPYARSAALTMVGRMGNKEHVSAIEPMMADTTIVATLNVNQRIGAGGVVNNGVPRTIQVGDVALAMTIHLSGQKPADFGYEMTRTNSNAVFSYANLGFPDEATRADSRRKWKEWLDKNKEEKK
jgi:hypothetical protein